MPTPIRRIVRIVIRILVGIFVVYGLAVGTGAMVGFWIGKEQKSHLPEPHAEIAVPHEQAASEHISPEHADPVPQSEPEQTAPPAIVEEPEVTGWKKNAVLLPPYTYRDKKLIAVIIDDLGMNTAKTKEISDMKVPLVMSFLPYAPRIEKQVKAARANGHEILVHMPMEPTDADAHPGPHALMTDLSDEENRANFAANMNKFDSYIGVNNHMGSKFTADPAQMKWVLEEIKKQDLIFIDSMTSPKSIAGRMANEMGILSAKRDVFLDDEDDADKIREQLKKLERIAKKQGSAIAIGHPRQNTITVLREWFASIEASEYMVVPLSVILQERQKIAEKKD